MAVPPYVGMAKKTNFYLFLFLYKYVQNGGHIECVSVQTLIFRLVMNFIRPKTLRLALWHCPIL